MSRFPIRTTTTHHILATIVFVALGAARSWAQTDVTPKPEPRACPPADQAAVRIPDSIQAPDDLRRQMEMMLQKSATFRSQCLRIARAPQLYVRVRVDLGLRDQPYRARTTICRMVSGAIVAKMDMCAWGDPTEWLAHEFEHLIEQLDGVEVGALARRRQGAWPSGPSGEQMFETERAIRAGHQVLHEVRDRMIARVLPERAATAAPEDQTLRARQSVR